MEYSFAVNINSGDVHVYLSIWFALEIQTALDGKYYVFPVYYLHV